MIEQYAKALPAIRASWYGYFYKAKMKKRLFLLWRIVILIAALAFMVSSFLWATEHSWDIAVIFSAIGLMLLITFFIVGKRDKMKRLTSGCKEYICILNRIGLPYSNGKPRNPDLVLHRGIDYIWYVNNPSKVYSIV